MTYITTPSAAQTGYHSTATTQTAEPREYVQGSSSRPSVPSELAPLSPRPSRDRVPSTNDSYPPSERYDPTSAMSVFSAWASYLSDDPGAGLESNWFHDQRSQSVWGGNASQHADTTRASADAPDFLSDLASIFSAPAGTEHEGNWFHDQRVYSQWSGATEGSNASYASAQTSSLGTNSSVSSLSEAASHVASHAPGSNAGGRSSTSISSSHLTSSVSSLHALSDAGSGPRPAGRPQSSRQSSTVEWQNRLPSVSSGGYNVSLTGSEQGALAAARGTGRFVVDSIADSASALGTGRFRAQEDARRAAKGKGVATSTASTASADSEWIAASHIVFSDGNGGPLPPGYHVYPLHTDSRASGLPPERPAPPRPRR